MFEVDNASCLPVGLPARRVHGNGKWIGAVHIPYGGSTNEILPNPFLLLKLLEMIVDQDIKRRDCWWGMGFSGVSPHIRIAALRATGMMAGDWLERRQYWWRAGRIDCLRR